MKRYVIFAGVNGAGKTTLYQTDYFSIEMPRVNVDEIVRSFGRWDNSADVMKAGKIAARLIKKHLEEGTSFNQETTLCGRRIIENIKKAKALGFRIEMYYVGLESADIAKQRVRQRVADGGHGVADEDIERRYSRSLRQLKQVFQLCDTIVLFDNSYDFVQIGFIEKGKPYLVRKDLPDWARFLFDG